VIFPHYGSAAYRMESREWLESLFLYSNRLLKIKVLQYRDGETGGQQDEESKEMTLDEWKSIEEAKRVKAEFNIRKPGEGCSGDPQWKKMYVLSKKEKVEVHEDEDEQQVELLQCDGFSSNNNKCTLLSCHVVITSEMPAALIRSFITFSYYELHPHTVCNRNVAQRI